LIFIGGDLKYFILRGVMGAALNRDFKSVYICLLQGTLKMFWLQFLMLKLRVLATKSDKFLFACSITSAKKGW
jgi:hypothetical protein